MTIIEQQPEQKKEEKIIPKLEEKIPAKLEEKIPAKLEEKVPPKKEHDDPQVLEELKETASKQTGEISKLGELMKPVKMIEKMQKELGSKIKQPIKHVKDVMTAIPKKFTDTLISRMKPENESADDFEGDESDDEEPGILGFLRKPTDDQVNHEISKREAIKKLLKKGAKVGAEAKKKLVKEEKHEDPIKEVKHITKKSKPQSSGIYVSTGPNYFAIISPKLEHLGWKR